MADALAWIHRGRVRKWRRVDSLAVCKSGRPCGNSDFSLLLPAAELMGVTQEVLWAHVLADRLHQNPTCCARGCIKHKPYATQEKHE